MTPRLEYAVLYNYNGPASWPFFISRMLGHKIHRITSPALAYPLCHRIICSTQPYGRCSNLHSGSTGITVSQLNWFTYVFSVECFCNFQWEAECVLAYYWTMRTPFSDQDRCFSLSIPFLGWCTVAKLVRSAKRPKWGAFIQELRRYFQE